MIQSVFMIYDELTCLRGEVDCWDVEAETDDATDHLNMIWNDEGDDDESA